MTNTCGLTAAIKPLLICFYSLFTLRSHCHPMVDRRLPVQIPILDDVAHVEEPRAFWWLRSLYVYVAHASAYLHHVRRHVKSNAARLRLADSGAAAMEPQSRRERGEVVIRGFSAFSAPMRCDDEP